MSKVNTDYFVKLAQENLLLRRQLNKTYGACTVVLDSVHIGLEHPGAFLVCQRETCIHARSILKAIKDGIEQVPKADETPT